MAYAAEELELVLLEAHARAAAVAEAPPGELGGDVVDEDGQAGRQALDRDHQGRSVGLARRQEAQHVDSSTVRDSRAFTGARSADTTAGRAPVVVWISRVCVPVELCRGRLARGRRARRRSDHGSGCENKRP